MRGITDAERLVPYQLFKFFLFGLTVDTLCGDGPCQKPFFRDRSPTGVTDTKGAVTDTSDGFLQLGNQLPLPVPDTKFKIPV